MNKLYIISVLSFCIFDCRGALGDARGEVLFPGADNGSVRALWDGLPPELKVKTVRDKVVSNCAQLLRVSPWGVAHSLSLSGEYRGGLDSLAWSADGRLAGSGEAAPRTGSEIKIWNGSLNEGQDVLPSAPLQSLSWNATGDKLAGIRIREEGPAREVIQLRNLRSGEVQYLFRDVELGEPGGAWNGRSIAWLDDNKLAVGFLDGMVKIIDTQTGITLRTLTTGEGHQLNVQNSRLAWDGVSKRLAAGRAVQGGYRVKIYTMAEDAPSKITDVLSLESDAISLEWGQDSKLEVGFQDGRVVGVDPATGNSREKFRLPEGRYTAMARAADGAIAVALHDGDLKIWRPYSDILKNYFAHEIAQLMREHKLSLREAYEQMLVTLFIFDLGEQGRTPVVHDIINEINRRAGHNITSVTEFKRIFRTFPDYARVAIDKIFNI